MVEPAVVRRGVLIGAALLCFCAGGLYGWSALIPFLSISFSRRQSNLVWCSLWPLWLSQRRSLLHHGFR